MLVVKIKARFGGRSELYRVRMKGLEPPRPETLDPKSNAATNYATRAFTPQS